jgi:hypothetical protein
VKNQRHPVTACVTLHGGRLTGIKKKSKFYENGTRDIIFQTKIDSENG